MKLIEDIVFSETCERDWREHEEFFSRKISVLRKNDVEKKVS